jgi:hypothetical protein
MWIRQEPSLFKREEIWVDTGNTKPYTHDIEQLRLEALFFGLRPKKGVSFEELKDQFDCDLFARKGISWITSRKKD